MLEIMLVGKPRINGDFGLFGGGRISSSSTIMDKYTYSTDTTAASTVLDQLGVI